MKTYTFPVIYTITGWIMIKAISIEEAKQKAEEMNDEGVNFSDIEDSDTFSEVIVGEGTIVG